MYNTKESRGASVEGLTGYCGGFAARKFRSERDLASACELMVWACVCKGERLMVFGDAR